MSEATSEKTTYPGRENSNSLQGWIAIGISVATLLLSIYAIREAHKSATITTNLQTTQLLSDAFKLLGGNISTGAIRATKVARSDLEAANQILDQVLLIDPKNSTAHRYRGVYFQATGKLDEALGVFKDLASRYPEDAKSALNVGNVYHARRNYAEAIEWYRKAVDVDPGLAVAAFSLARTLHSSGQLEEAAKYFRKAIDINSEYIEAYFGLITVLEAQDLLDEAVGICRKIIAIAPTKRRGYESLLELLEKQGRTQEMEEIQKRLDIFSGKASE